MDNIIKIIQVSKLEVKDIKLDKNLEKEVELAPAILSQNNDKAKNLDIDVNANKVEANDNKLA